jgi:hypothetical protein
MRYIAVVAIILAVEMLTFGSGPARNEMAVAAAKAFDGVNHRNFVGNIIGLQLPAPRPLLATSELFKMILIPELAIQWLEEWSEEKMIDWLYGIGKGRPDSIWQLLKDKMFARDATE